MKFSDYFDCDSAIAYVSISERPTIVYVEEFGDYLVVGVNETFCTLRSFIERAYRNHNEVVSLMGDMIDDSDLTGMKVSGCSIAKMKVSMVEYQKLEGFDKPPIDIFGLM